MTDYRPFWLINQLKEQIANKPIRKEILSKLEQINKDGEGSFKENALSELEMLEELELDLMGFDECGDEDPWVNQQYSMLDQQYEILLKKVTNLIKWKTKKKPPNML